MSNNIINIPPGGWHTTHFMVAGGGSSGKSMMSMSMKLRTYLDATFQWKDISTSSSKNGRVTVTLNSLAAKDYTKELTGHRYHRMILAEDDPILLMLKLKFEEEAKCSLQSSTT